MTTPTESRAPAERPTVVAVEDARRTYDNGRVRVEALRGVSCTLAQGEFVALVGSSGSGKSTLLGLVSAVDRPDGGRVVVCGQDLGDASESDLTRLRRHDVGVVFQSFHLLPNLTARQNVALPLSLDGRKDPARVDELLRRVGLEDRLDHYPSELSGGEEQRVAIARALVHRPKLLVADEPTGNLDSVRGAGILDLLDDLRREESVALLVATHDPEVAARADRVLHLRDGALTDDPGPTARPDGR